ncbi:22.7 kDa class IV heat shock protein isoform X2 [Lathyrus oleraceus]|uniref:22.7 kDa class IV heat shock protein isoform X2 n=1 Tax=Pisum sativum TaxID=3888 RepID=UPI0021D07F05|nr:22.7 kDa class IV heat shock protein isoform X2 [Pisum sativum]
MEVELGLKITRTKDDSTSISDFQFAKDRAGYKKENIDININKDGTKISVSGEKEVQEMQMMPFKKEVKTKGFRKKFKIPNGVILDKIKAKYNEDEGRLTIVMPKIAKGELCGVGIEEVKEEEGANSIVSEPEQIVAEEEKILDNKSEEENAPVKKRRSKKPWHPCPPLVFGGSTLLASIIFLVLHYMRVRKS